ncbi:MAG: lysophospholipid acyltransferase family protein [Bacteroidales bacterium]|jgi:KDO2-lipid IV(A) lauroyltransferase|nr:lysophospholipid acyltransferase family protein [Bacteroidales bacterium]
MITRLLFRFVLYPLSHLPLWLLYIKGYLFYLVARYMMRYRSKVIDYNLHIAFPNKSKRELKKIKNRYYIHLSEIAVEMLKMLTINKKELKERYLCTCPEKVNRYFDENRSVILVSSHYNNWEWMVLALNLMFKHSGVGVGAPNSNKDFETMVNRARTRYGTSVVFADTIREEFERREQEKCPTAYMMLSDQSPPHPDRSYHTLFFKHPSGVIFGAEHYAKKYNFPVIYYEVIKEKRGYYRVHLDLITDEPRHTAHGEITEAYLRRLEKVIKEKPEYWLWSHRRWKHEIKI